MVVLSVIHLGSTNVPQRAVAGLLFLAFTAMVLLAAALILRATFSARLCSLITFYAQISIDVAAAVALLCGLLQPQPSPTRALYLGLTLLACAPRASAQGYVPLLASRLALHTGATVIMLPAPLSDLAAVGALIASHAAVGVVLPMAVLLGTRELTGTACHAHGTPQGVLLGVHTALNLYNAASGIAGAVPPPGAAPVAAATLAALGELGKLDPSQSVATGLLLASGTLFVVSFVVRSLTSRQRAPPPRSLQLAARDFLLRLDPSRRDCLPLLCALLALQGVTLLRVGALWAGQDLQLQEVAVPVVQIMATGVAVAVMVMYVFIPDDAAHASGTPTTGRRNLYRSFDALRAAPLGRVSLDAAPSAGWSGLRQSLDESRHIPQHMRSRASSSELMSGSVAAGAEAFCQRIQSLAHFKSFIQSTGSALSKGAALKSMMTTVRATFPQCTTCTLTLVAPNSRDLLNVFHLLGDGPLSQPEYGVAIAPSTLLQKSLRDSKPIFIGSCAAAGPQAIYPDIQYMRFVLGVQSAAFLPVVLPGRDRPVGVLVMGCSALEPWTPPETSLAQQLVAAIAASTECFLRRRDSSTPTVIYGVDQAYTQRPERLEAEDTPDPDTPLQQDCRQSDTAHCDAARHMGDLLLLNLIGVGGFAQVFKAEWQGMIVAVKVIDHGNVFTGISTVSSDLTGPGSGSRERLDALEEGALSCAVQHPYVVHSYDYRTLGVNQDGVKASSRLHVKKETHIIMEFCDRGSLHSCLRERQFHGAVDEQPPAMDFEAIATTLDEVAQAMIYLHSLRITHRDLKCKNVLLKAAPSDPRGFTAKISDLGLSQVMEDAADGPTHISTRYSGTVTHMPPELLEDGRVYLAGDVYAFAMIMWEVLTVDTPYRDMKRPQIMMGVVVHDLRPAIPAHCPPWYAALIQRCWARDPKSRPTFKEIHEVIGLWQDDRIWETQPGGYRVLSTPRPEL